MGPVVALRIAHDLHRRPWLLIVIVFPAGALPHCHCFCETAAAIIQAPAAATALLSLFPANISRGLRHQTSPSWRASINNSHPRTVYCYRQPPSNCHSTVSPPLSVASPIGPTASCNLPSWRPFALETPKPTPSPMKHAMHGPVRSLTVAQVT
jgi:hypothetical protein